MSIDGEKLRNLRLQKGMSQEKLGLMAKLNKRTIQRAENGAPIAIESLAFIAEALEVDSNSLRSRQFELLDQGEAPKEKRRGEVILIPVARGSRLVNTLYNAFQATFKYEAEATEENLNLLQEISEVLNRAWENPWEPRWRNGDSVTDWELLQLQAKVNRLIPVLGELGIRVFMGTYMSYQQKPMYDLDEDSMYVRNSTPRELVTNVQVVISDESVGHLSYIPADHIDFEEIQS